jgi:hypothetical protein
VIERWQFENTLVSFVVECQNEAGTRWLARFVRPHLLSSFVGYGETAQRAATDLEAKVIVELQGLSLIMRRSSGITERLMQYARAAIPRPPVNLHDLIRGNPIETVKYLVRYLDGREGG